MLRSIAVVSLVLLSVVKSFIIPSPTSSSSASLISAKRTGRPAGRLYGVEKPEANDDSEESEELTPSIVIHTVEPKEEEQQGGLMSGFLAGMKPNPAWKEEDGLYVDGLVDTELPDSFEDALQIAVDAAKEAFETGRKRVRIEFDTTAGDLTYTTLKNSMPLALAVAKFMGSMVLEEDKIEVDENGKKRGYTGKRLAVIFPDTGSAVWVEQDWKVGKGSRRVPMSVRCAAFPNEMVDHNDAAFLIVCPKASESQATYELLTSISPDAPVVLMNPELINAEVVGFGMAGRRIRDEVENKFERAYYLKTLSWGALTRRWPADYSVWLEDEGKEEGYRLLKTVGRFPSMDELEDIRMASDSKGGENRGMLQELGRFIDSFRRM